MSLASRMIASAAAAFNIIQADTWTVLNGSLAGSTFQGDAQTESVIAIDGDMGSDAREKTMLYCDRPCLALNRGTMLGCNGAQWTVIGDMDDNPFNSRVKFEIVKKSAKDE